MLELTMKELQILSAALTAHYSTTDEPQRSHLPHIPDKLNSILHLHKKVEAEIEKRLLDGSNQAIATMLEHHLKAKAPAYWVRWNPDIFLFPDEPKGAFEIGIDDKVHYRRRTPEGVLKLANLDESLLRSDRP